MGHWKKVAMIVCVLGLVACGGSGSPSKDTVKASVKKILPVEFEVADVRAMKEVPGIYEVVIKLGNQAVVFYTDKTTRYLVNGSIVDSETKKNLTMERQQALNPAPVMPPASPAKPVKPGKK